VDVVAAPFLATGSDAREVAAAAEGLKQRIAFYASTRTYHPVLELHGWTDVGLRLHELSREGKWREMAALISDQMLSELAVVGTYDELASRIRERCSRLFSTVLLDLPRALWRDEGRVRGIVEALHEP
jgi:alkanesulfonate monooxygenase SsuD/methylene tetrahydromethanopterin reductase-like flavin-dependent oxidoreductase (luciferase family)